MYKILTPAGTLVVDTYREAIEYKKLYGYPFEEIADEFEPSEIWGEETDCMGNNFSDADPGL